MERSEIERLYQQYGSLVFRRAKNILRHEEDALDAMQEVFARVLVKGESFRGESNIMTWLYSVTTHLCLNKLRNTKRRSALLEGRQQTEIAPDLPDPEMIQLVHELLGSVPEELAQVAVYFYYDDLTHDEISKILGCSRRKVGDLLERFRKILLAQEKVE